MRLRDVTAEDGPLFERTLCDDEMMRHLGGVITREAALETMQRQLDLAAAGRALASVVVSDEGDDVGSVCLWLHAGTDTPRSEMGWMVLPAFQGRGFATAAVLALLDRAAAAGEWGDVHAYPAVANAASNAICRATGFELVGTVDVEYQGRPLRCNDWAIRDRDRLT
jgi:RimJ/RimL family protein N-acetyltransferase